MARLTRVVVPGMPHHVTQRGDRRHGPCPSPLQTGPDAKVLQIVKIGSVSPELPVRGIALLFPSGSATAPPFACRSLDNQRHLRHNAVQVRVCNRP